MIYFGRVNLVYKFTKKKISYIYQFLQTSLRTYVAYKPDLSTKTRCPHQFKKTHLPKT